MEVAVIIPAFNASLYIRDALDSVRAQIRQPNEVIVVDDASTDGTASTIEEWSLSTGFDVTIHRMEKNGGAGAARNAGFLKSHSELVAMLDADDLWHPNMIETLAGKLESNPELVACFGHREFLNVNGATGEYQGKKRLDETRFILGADGMRIYDRRSAFELNLVSAITSCSAAVVARAPAVACGLFDEAFRTSEDREFFLRLALAGSFGFVPIPVALYRLHNDNTSHMRHKLHTRINALRVLDKLFRRRWELGLTSEETDLTKTALNSAAQSAIYTSSQYGLPTLARVVRTARKTEAQFSILQARLLARAAWRTVQRDPAL